MKADVQSSGSLPAPGSADRAGRDAPGTSILRSRLFIKYVALFVSVVVLALVANGAFEVWFSFQEQKAALTNLQHQEAVAAADKIEEFVTQIQSQLGWTTQLPWTNGTLDQRRFDALRLLRQVPAITELAQIDAGGHEQLKVSRLTMDVIGSGIDYSNKPEFKEAAKNKVYYGPVYFRRESEPYMTIALAGARVENGVSIAQVNLKLIWDVVSGIKVGENGHAYVVDSDGRLIAHPDISLVLRNTDMSKLAQVRAARAGGSGQDVQEADDLAGHKVLTAYARVHPLGWYVFVETPIEEAYAPLYRSIQRSGYVLFGALALAFIGGAFLARRMVVPIQALRSGAARIGAGDLGQRIDIKTGDEVEALANQFNAMAGQLQESYADLEKKVEDRTRELTESLSQQTATSEVLGVISSSPGDLKPVFESILANATRICQAEFGTIYRYDGTLFHTEAFFNEPPELVEFRKRRGPFRPPEGQPLERMMQIGAVVHSADDAAQPVVSPSARLGGARSHLAVPMFKEGTLVGAITIYRTEVRPFTEKQIELVKNFAAQAVIAIENTRLLSELRESLDQQTATSEVLKVISSSPGELEPVFQAMLENATRICEATAGNIYRWDGEMLTLVASHNTPAGFVELVKNTPQRATTDNLVGRMLATKSYIHAPDVREHPSYIQRSEALSVAAVEIAGVRTLLVMPLLKDDELIGSFTLYRDKVLPFADNQIALVRNFADQAVIAIENARLLSELRVSLEQQTATAEVLGVINASRGDLQPVFEAMVEKARRLCEADAGHLALPAGGDFRSIAVAAMSPEMERTIRSVSYAPGRGTAIGRALAERRPVQISDIGADSEHVARHAADKGFIRTILGVPLLREGEAIGAFGLSRQRVEPFSERQIELVRTFAEQAVIAIENTRLLNELRESLAQQTATAEVLSAIARSRGDLGPVFDIILASANRLCEANYGTMYLREGAGYRATARQGHLPATSEQKWWKGDLFQPRQDVPFGRAVATGRPVLVHDLATEPAYLDRDPWMIAGVDEAGIRSMCAVPMMKGAELVGVMAFYRREVRPFTEKQIALVENFAAQAVIAIENTRLLSELRQRTDDLTQSLNELRTAQDRLVQTEKLASLGQLTAGIAHEIKNPLNFVNNFSSVSVELIDELQQELAKVQVDGAARAEIDDLAETLKGNLDKIVQHGKRADSIVKNMLLHSRAGSGEHRLVDVNALVEESLNLAYHGARAEKQGFNITLERAFDPTAGDADLYPQEVTRVLLNLIANGFYAAHKRKTQADGNDFEPTLAASTKNLGDRVEIRIRDNGTGIPPEVKERMFNPFFTTKPAGEGTGLGLSISHDIIVKQHAGSITVETEPGQFTEFRIVLPRRAAAEEITGGRA